MFATRPRFLVDTNLLVLLVIGATHRALVARHKNSSRFQPSDYDRLVQVLSAADHIVITPNIATETSNLIRQITAPYDLQISETFARMVARFVEIVIGSAEASTHSDAAVLGLADAVTLRVLRNGYHLLTTDTTLYVAAKIRGFGVSHFDRLQPEPT